MGLTASARFRKSSAVVGDVLGKYHPHGDMAVYDALVKLAQNMRFKLENLPIVFSGGVFNVSPVLEETIRQTYPDATFNRASSALSAARMALENLKT